MFLLILVVQSYAQICFKDIQLKCVQCENNHIVRDQREIELELVISLCQQEQIEFKNLWLVQKSRTFKDDLSTLKKFEQFLQQVSYPESVENNLAPFFEIDFIQNEILILQQSLNQNAPECSYFDQQLYTIKLSKQTIEQYEVYFNQLIAKENIETLFDLNLNEIKFTNEFYSDFNNLLGISRNNQEKLKLDISNFHTETLYNFNQKLIIIEKSLQILIFPNNNYKITKDIQRNCQIYDPYSSQYILNLQNIRTRQLIQEQEKQQEEEQQQQQEEEEQKNEEQEEAQQEEEQQEEQQLEEEEQQEQQVEEEQIKQEEESNQQEEESKNEEQEEQEQFEIQGYDSMKEGKIKYNFSSFGSKDMRKYGECDLLIKIEQYIDQEVMNYWFYSSNQIGLKDDQLIFWPLFFKETPITVKVTIRKFNFDDELEAESIYYFDKGTIKPITFNQDYYVMIKNVLSQILTDPSSSLTKSNYLTFSLISLQQAMLYDTISADPCQFYHQTYLDIQKSQYCQCTDPFIGRLCQWNKSKIQSLISSKFLISNFLLNYYQNSLEIEWLQIIIQFPIFQLDLIDPIFSKINHLQDNESHFDQLFQIMDRILYQFTNQQDDHLIKRIVKESKIIEVLKEFQVFDKEQEEEQAEVIEVEDSEDFLFLPEDNEESNDRLLFEEGEQIISENEEENTEEILLKEEVNKEEKEEDEIVVEEQIIYVDVKKQLKERLVQFKSQVKILRRINEQLMNLLVDYIGQKHLYYGYSIVKVLFDFDLDIYIYQNDQLQMQFVSVKIQDEHMANLKLRINLEINTKQQFYHLSSAQVDVPLFDLNTNFAVQLIVFQPAIYKYFTPQSVLSPIIKVTINELLDKENVNIIFPKDALMLMEIPLFIEINKSMLLACYQIDEFTMEIEDEGCMIYERKEGVVKVAIQKILPIFIAEGFQQKYNFNEQELRDSLKQEYREHQQKMNTNPESDYFSDTQNRRSYAFILGLLLQMVLFIEL